MRTIRTVLVGGAAVLAVALPVQPATAGCVIAFLCGSTTPTTAPAVTVPPVTLPPATLPPVTAPPTTAPPAARPAAALRAQSARLVSLVNRERAARGLGALAVRSAIASVAEGHSDAMAAKGTIYHNDGYFTTVVRRTLGASALGENVALNPSIDNAH